MVYCTLKIVGDISCHGAFLRVKHIAVGSTSLQVSPLEVLMDNMNQPG